jgi:hypothetical protein
VKDLFHRVGAVEVAVTRLETTQDVLVKADSDKETRIRSLEHLTAKVVGGAIVGSALGGWLLSKLGALVP